jgi:hypothetical protein
MKKLFAILLVTVLTSCGSLIESPKSNLEPPKSITDYKNIIGMPIKIGNIEVAQYDFPEKMNWQSANYACVSLGNGWRLPTKEELNILYFNKNKIGGFDALGPYWSSTEKGLINGEIITLVQYFNADSQGLYGKNATLFVRAIRAI